jgi:hypothetical protein
MCTNNKILIAVIVGLLILNYTKSGSKKEKMCGGKCM